MRTVTTVSLSPAIDRRIEFERFAIGATNRVIKTKSEGCGKAVNVALSARALGIDACCVGLLGENGGLVTRRLEKAGVKCSFLTAPGEVRTNQKLFDHSTGVTTEINEPVPEAPKALLQRAADLAVNAAKESEILVLTGSLPQRCPADWYARVIRRVHEEAPQCRCVLDAEGERFTLGIQERPWLVKPNRYELELWAGQRLPEVQSVIEAARKLALDGPEIVMVSMGEDGAVLVTDRQAWWGKAPVEQVQTTVGAGDAMVAGVIYSAMFSSDPERMLACGVAAAAARVQAPAEMHIQDAVFAEKLEKVEISAQSV